MKRPGTASVVAITKPIDEDSRGLHGVARIDADTVLHCRGKVVAERCLDADAGEPLRFYEMTMTHVDALLGAGAIDADCRGRMTIRLLK